jgi:hypothetical protein
VSKDKRKNLDPFTNHRVQVRENSRLSHTIRVGSEGTVYDWHNSEELNGDIVMEVKFEGYDFWVECEPHEVNFLD